MIQNKTIDSSARIATITIAVILCHYTHAFNYSPISQPYETARLTMCVCMVTGPVLLDMGLCVVNENMRVVQLTMYHVLPPDL